MLAVLLLVAVTGAIAAAAMESLALSRAAAGNVVALDQARAYAGAVEQLAAVTVDDMIVENPNRTTLAGGWNGAVRRVALPGGGVAQVRVRDGGNCFNVNSVVSGDPRTRLARRPSGVAQLTGLMQALRVPEGEARRIAEAAADWADSDAVPSPGGAEDGAYGGGDLPYRTGNTLFADVGELGALAGMTPEIMARLRPWLCALPTTELSPLNFNTLLPEQAPLLAMLAPGQLDVERARRVLAARRPEAGATRSSSGGSTRCAASTCRSTSSSAPDADPLVRARRDRRGHGRGIHRIGAARRAAAALAGGRPPLGGVKRGRRKPMKSVLLYANPDAGLESRLQAALDVTRLFEGHLTCLQVTPYDLFIMGDPFGGIYALPTMIEQVRRTADEHRERMEQRLRGEGVAWDWLRFDGAPAQLIVDRARLCDLIVLSLPGTTGVPASRTSPPTCSSTPGRRCWRSRPPGADWTRSARR